MSENNARTRSAWTDAVAAQIRAERAASGLTQRQVMEASGLPKSTYLRLESGERVADADQIARFTAAVGMRLSTFFQRVEDRQATAAPEVRADHDDALTPTSARGRRRMDADEQRGLDLVRAEGLDAPAPRRATARKPGRKGRAG